MKSLILIRHAKSSWELPVKDKDRTLTEKGIETIKKVALEALPFISESFTIWSSTANRASQTAFLFCEKANINHENIVYKEALYTFNDANLEEEIRKCDNNINHLMVFGHNEAITDLVNKLGDKYVMNVPTSCFIKIQFDQENWKNISKGKVIKTIFPKEITS
jgi:phosphohistidine phosphatase